MGFTSMNSLKATLPEENHTRDDSNNHLGNGMTDHQSQLDSVKASKPISLLGLPLELRHQIYREYCYAPAGVRFGTKDVYKSNRPGKRLVLKGKESDEIFHNGPFKRTALSHTPPRKLLCINRQIKREMISYFYSANRFHNSATKRISECTLILNNQWTRGGAHPRHLACYLSQIEDPEAESEQLKKFFKTLPYCTDLRVLEIHFILPIPDVEALATLQETSVEDLIDRAAKSSLVQSVPYLKNLESLVLEWGATCKTHAQESYKNAVLGVIRHNMFTPPAPNIVSQKINRRPKGEGDWIWDWFKP